MQALMFVARCLGVSLAVFILLYAVLSLVVSFTWTSVARLASRLSPRHSAAVLFVLRTLPLLVSATFTLAVTVPSYLILEPRTTDEEIGIAPLALGFCCLALIVMGLLRAVRAQRKTSQALEQWLSGAQPVESQVSLPLFRTIAPAPSLTVAGVCTPKVLVSEAALSILTTRELRTALKHEVAHVRHHDNLKKLIFRFIGFPGMAALEAAWSEAAEMAADDAAVSSLGDALDLAAALIKLSRLVPVQPSAALATGLLQSSSACLRVRVQRLFAWRSHSPSPDRRALRYLLPSIFLPLLCFVAGYSSVLAGMHAATEWLVR
jgi:Zn-dependent protease with chaperone function